MLASRVDVREYRIPDIYIVIPSIIAIILSSFGGLMDIANIIAQGTVVLLFFVLFRRVVNGNFGLGDVKLIGASTLAFGVAGVFVVVMTASLTGIMWGLLPRHRGVRIPFAPFLAVGMIVSSILSEYFGVIPCHAT